MVAFLFCQPLLNLHELNNWSHHKASLFTFGLWQNSIDLMILYWMKAVKRIFCIVFIFWITSVDRDNVSRIARVKIDCSPAPQYSGSQAHAFTDGTMSDRKDITRYLHFNSRRTRENWASEITDWKLSILMMFTFLLNLYCLLHGIKVSESQSLG